MIIEVQYQEGAKEQFRLSSSTVIIGRSKQSDVVLSYPGISRQHFKLELVKGEFFVTDLGSTNGVYVNNEKLPVNERVSFKNFFPLVIGETVFTIINDEPTDAEPNMSAKPLQFDYDKKASSTSTSIEKTRVLTKAPRKVTPKKSGMMSNVVVGLLLIGGAGAYYYFTNIKAKENANANEQVTESSESSREEDSVVGERKGKKGKGKNKSAEFSFDETEAYKAIWEKAGCNSEEEKRICAIVKKEWKEKESLIITDKGIYIFLDLGEEIKNKEQSYPYFSKLTLKEKVEMILAYYATHPLLFSEAGDRKLPIIAIGFEKKEVKISLQYATQSNSKLKLGLTPEQQNALFSRAFLGEVYEYKQFLKPIIDTIEL